MIGTRVLSLCTALLALGACGVERIDEDDGGGGDGGGGSSAVPAAVQQRLTQSCALTGCHVSGTISPDLSAASGGAWVEQSGAGGPFVTFGDPGNSYLVEKMQPGPSMGSQMPLPPGQLSAEDLAVIVGWVAGVEFPDGDGDGDDDGGDASSDGMDDSGESDDATTGTPALTLCSLEVIDPSAESPVDAGDEAGKIPSSIGAALERNCGCHYTSSAMTPYIPFTSGNQLQTLANFTNDYSGSISTYLEMPAWMAVQDRVINLRNMPMALCETEEGGTITAADFALFEAWFDQEVPDGANFTPPS